MLVLSKKACVAVVLLLFVCTSMVHAKTISVMQDGSTAFDKIQPALNAVASGDTLYIGPGEYFDFNTMYFPGYPEDPEVYAFIPVDNLTVVGAGRDETIVGPAIYEVIGGTYSPICFRWQGGGVLRISGLTMRNCFEGIHSDPGIVYVDDCNFLDNRSGVAWETLNSGGGVSNSTFQSDVPGGPEGLFFMGSGRDIVVEDCLFDGAGIAVQNLESITIRGSEIWNCVVGLQVDNGTHCYVENCRVFNCVNVGVGLLGPSTVCDIVDSYISGGGSAMYVGAFCQVSAIQTLFEGGYWSVIEFSSGDSSTVSNCDLFQGTGPLIRSYRHPSYDPVIHDLRNNYWGMINPEGIRAIILDGTNDPDNASIVLFEPFVGDLSPANSPQPLDSLAVHPNPFNPCTTVSFSIDFPQNVEISIFDLTGKRIAELADRTLQPGVHSFGWQGKDIHGSAVASGTYLVRMTSEGEVSSQKMMLVR